MTLTAACSRLASIEDWNNVGCDCCLTDPDLINERLDYASDILFVLSGGAVFGECEATVRPCRACWCQMCWSCCHLEQIPLRQDATEIVSVKVDGDTLDPSTYRLTSRGFLSKVSNTDRPTPWPGNQKLWRADTEAATFSITYKFGYPDPQPQYVVDACVELACASARATHPGSGKQLSGRVTQIFTGGGVIQLNSAAEQARQAGSDLPAVLTFLSVVNPGFKGNTMIFSPDDQGAWSMHVDS